MCAPPFRWIVIVGRKLVRVEFNYVHQLQPAPTKGLSAVCHGLALDGVRPFGPITGNNQSPATDPNPKSAAAGVSGVQLELTVCAVSRHEIGVLIGQDDSGVELLEMGDFGQEIHPGDRVRIQGNRCLLRKRDMGIQISAIPVVDNDAIHLRRTFAAVSS